MRRFVLLAALLGAAAGAALVGCTGNSSQQAAGGKLREVRISRLAAETFYAVAAIEGSDGAREVDARPSDAVSLALVTGAPIRVERSVLDAVERQR